jgi:hypothetical protein
MGIEYAFSLNVLLTFNDRIVEFLFSIWMLFSGQFVFDRGYVYFTRPRLVSFSGGQRYSDSDSVPSNGKSLLPVLMRSDYQQSCNNGSPDLVK